MNANTAHAQIIRQLTPRYGAAEAKSIANIVMWDAFGLMFFLQNHTLSQSQFELFSQIIGRLMKGEPVQYVLGQADFLGLKFKVNPSVLIPRQETEELVAWVLEHLKDNYLHEAVMLDIGIGSGCIGIVLKKKMPKIQMFGIEKSRAALKVALENVEYWFADEVAVDFSEGDILQPSDWSRFPKLDVVVSNPPYIPISEKSLMPEHVTEHEPEMALFVSDDDPFVFYHAIADFSLQKLRPGGALFLECNEFNASMVAYFLSRKGFSNVELRKDIAGKDRMVRAILPA